MLPTLRFKCATTSMIATPQVLNDSPGTFASGGRPLPPSGLHLGARSLADLGDQLLETELFAQPILSTRTGPHARLLSTPSEPSAAGRISGIWSTLSVASASPSAFA